MVGREWSERGDSHRVAQTRGDIADDRGRYFVADSDDLTRVKVANRSWK